MANIYGAKKTDGVSKQVAVDASGHVQTVTSFKILQTVTRPSDTPGAYHLLDAITNSTSSPAIMTQDLAAYQKQFC